MHSRHKTPLFRKILTAINQAKRWLKEIELARKRDQPYYRNATRAYEQYTNYKNSDAHYDDDQYARSGDLMSLFWSNVETLRPAMYSSTPKVEVFRRYKDKDAIAREASENLERSTQ